MDSSDEGADGDNAPPNFCARTAPVVNQCYFSSEILFILVLTQFARNHFSFLFRSRSFTKHSFQFLFSSRS